MPTGSTVPVTRQIPFHRPRISLLQCRHHGNNTTMGWRIYISKRTSSNTCYPLLNVYSDSSCQTAYSYQFHVFGACFDNMKDYLTYDSCSASSAVMSTYYDQNCDIVLDSTSTAMATCGASASKTDVCL